MTEGELKFALQVEAVLNKIPQPEYRQLMVEAMMVLILIEQHDNGKTRWDHVISVEKLVHSANEIFIAEQVCTNCWNKRDSYLLGAIQKVCQNKGSIHLLLPDRFFLLCGLFSLVMILISIPNCLTNDIHF